MTHASSEMAKKAGQKTHEQQSFSENDEQNTPLHSRYRQIGISAVAAAVRYQGVAKNPAYAPASLNWRDYASDAA